jgi:hypothetical protein
MPQRRQWLLATVSVVVSTVLTIGLIELVLQFLPVATGMLGLPVTENSPLYRFEPNSNFVFSIGWKLDGVNRGHVNNAGFVNDQDYQKSATTPLLAVVGDSFIEAAMIPYPRTVQGRLTAALAGERRVYSFGTAGAPLSQYLILARHAVDEYSAQAVVISVVFNDFDESYFAYRPADAYWYYVPDGDGALHLKLFQHHRSLLRSLVVKSALARYLLINLQIDQVIHHTPFLKSLVVGPAHAQSPSAGDLPPDADAERMRISYAVIEAFFRDLAAMVKLPPDRVLFTLDGFHYPESAAAARGYYFDRMRRAFAARATALGYGLIDLDPFFFSDFARHGDRYEIPGDGHWTAHAHGVIADAVLASDFMQRLRPRTETHSGGTVEQ